MISMRLPSVFRLQRVLQINWHSILCTHSYKSYGFCCKRYEHTLTFRSFDSSVIKKCIYVEGQTILDVAFENDIEMEGACGGDCACSTCHVILKEEDYDKFPEPTDDELDMLDLALDLTETSRLGCQLQLTAKHDGLEVELPQETLNQMLE